MTISLECLKIVVQNVEQIYCLFWRAGLEKARGKQMSKYWEKITNKTSVVKQIAIEGDALSFALNV